VVNLYTLDLTSKKASKIYQFKRRLFQPIKTIDIDRTLFSDKLTNFPRFLTEVSFSWQAELMKWLGTCGAQ
jgi:hypothetical protein